MQDHQGARVLRLGLGTGYKEFSKTLSILLNMSLPPKTMQIPSSKIRWLTILRILQGQMHQKRTESAPDTYPLSPSAFEVAPKLPSVGEVGIREHLRLWQEGQSEPRAAAPLSTLPGLRLSSSGEISLSQSIENDSVDTFDDAMSGEEDDDALDSSEADIESQPYPQNSLEPGDVVQRHTSGEPIPAIFIRYLTDQTQFYSMTGKFLVRNASFGGDFVVRRMFSPQELDPLLPYLPSREVDKQSFDQVQAISPSQEVPRDIAGALLEKLRGFHRACAEAHRQHLGRLVRMHSLVAYQKSSREMMLVEIASVVLQKADGEELTDVMLWTTHAVLSRDMGFQRLNGRSHHLAPLWRVNSLARLQKYEQVRIWIREYQEGVISQATALNDHASPIDWQQDLMDNNPIPQFIEKTRRFIQDSRKNRSVVASSNIGPSRDPSRVRIARKSLEHGAIAHETTLTRFSSTEKKIISFLKSWCLTLEIPATGNTWSLGPILLRAIGRYDGHELNARTAHLFLMEVGVCAPWDDRNNYNADMRIPTSHDAKTQQLFYTAARQATAIAQGSETPDDSLANLRKDWANMAVYAIDSADAREIDDGISIEKIEGDESIFWVHVHIANPSAFIQPGDAVERYAARMTSTVYMTETVYPMLHPRLSQARFSLANDRPVLTVSIKLSVDGEIMERKLTPGWIHNLQRFTATQVSQALGNTIASPQAPSHVFKVGRSMGATVNPTHSTPLNSTAISDLRTLQQLGRARRIKRAGSLESAYNHMQRILIPDPHVYIQRDGLGPTYSSVGGRRFTGDPAISWEVQELDLNHQLGSAQISVVADMMVLACEVVGDWCSERNIPALYRGSEWNTTLQVLVEGYKAKFDAAVSDEHKFLSLRAWSRLEGMVTQNSMPVPHRLLGVPAYIQATSPLRRYTDMLVHWQLQAALLHEARHGRDSLIGSRDDSYLPFSRARLDTLIPNIDAHDRDIRLLSVRSKDHWIIQLLSRAFYFKEAMLPAVVDVFMVQEHLSSTSRLSGRGLLKQFNGYRTQVLHNDVAQREGGLKAGDWWQCRIEEVDTYNQGVVCLPIRLLKREVPA
ncbi:MAG: hypothetical protein Q9212_005165 [Teloschistes hypoglaucus]